ncbi:AraC family transcriptional regulator [Bradyrhizobium sp. MOS003]|uniref:AraC family transcriptional regulator n=1 Tax=Bradyrhizobium sp. MOS003 TaxID=2133946 RepID=UPI000D12C35E|nr:AraC family transcriptional regulator [Bradyrhizobium sp. MOS003]PSO14777.1 AraC family transcriptional regulator [Bradyrhizobium sp. MOS003]
MASLSTDVSHLRVSTRDIPESQRTAFWREEFARQMCRLEFESLSDNPLDVEANLLALPGLSIGWCCSGAAARWSRTSDLVKDGDDTFALVMPLAGAVQRSQRGQDVEVKLGEAVGILHSEPGSLEFRQLDDMVVMVPRSALAPLVPDVEAAATRIVANDALRLLQTYLLPWRENFDVTDPAVRRLSVTYIHDLLALALGSTRDAAEIASGRGVRVARLKAVKADIAANLTSRDLSVGSVALRQRVTPRYIHMLFDGEGTTFSQHVLVARLACARRLLLDSRHAHQSIAAIAYASGFGDLSHFNHAFRRRYGATPSEVRREQVR